MKSRLLIILFVGLFASIIIVNMFGTTCILVEEGTSKNWFGSIDGCGPMLTYSIHQYFGIFW